LGADLVLLLLAQCVCDSRSKVWSFAVSSCSPGTRRSAADLLVRCCCFLSAAGVRCPAGLVLEPLVSRLEFSYSTSVVDSWSHTEGVRGNSRETSRVVVKS
jgi:hypothetical protein